MHDKLTHAQAIEEIREAIEDSGGIRLARIEEILSRVKEEAEKEAEPQRGHARNCECCFNYEICCERIGGQQHMASVLHPYRDPRCAEPTQESMEEVKQHLGNLLALIFRDGGQRQHEIGNDAKAVDEATGIVCRWRDGMDAEKVREALQLLRDDASMFPADPPFTDAAFFDDLEAILSRVQPEPEQRGHARRCRCCPEYERPHSAQSSCKCPSCFCCQCGKLKSEHPYRDPRCSPFDQSREILDAGAFLAAPLPPSAREKVREAIRFLYHSLNSNEGGVVDAISLLEEALGGKRD